MKKGIVIAVAAIVAALSGIALAKTVGVLYGDALVIPYNGTQTAGITAAGAITGTSLVVSGPTTVYTRTEAQINVESPTYTAGSLYYCSDCTVKLNICTAAGTLYSVSTGTFN